MENDSDGEAESTAEKARLAPVIIQYGIHQ
jgi:hypothetical protein